MLGTNEASLNKAAAQIAPSFCAVLAYFNYCGVSVQANTRVGAVSMTGWSGTVSAVVGRSGGGGGGGGGRGEAWSDAQAIVGLH